jgi:hypothetical protein
MNARTPWLLALLALAAGCGTPDLAAVRQDCRAEIRRAERAGKTELAEELREDCLQPGVVHEPTQGPVPPDATVPPGLHDQESLPDSSDAMAPSIDGR